MRHAAVIRVPKALRAPHSDRWPPGSPPRSVASRPFNYPINELDALGGSTWLVPLSVLAL
jgi:hypothetical protein